MPVIVYCSNCGKEIRRTPALVKKNRTGKTWDVVIVGLPKGGSA